MSDQTTLFGDDRPEDLDLGVAQRAVIRKLRRLGSLDRAEVGAIVHAGRGKHSIDEVCPFCGDDGDDVIESLTLRRLVEQGPDGVIRPASAAAGFRNSTNPRNEETS